MSIKYDGCYDSDEYIEILTGNKPVIKPTLDELEKLELEYWNYPLTEIDHIIENDIDVVLVRFPNLYDGYDYRFCEVERS